MATETIPCGGCGETNPDDRCIGCLHEFGPAAMATDPHADSSCGPCETPMADHVAEFWRLLETEHVRILVNIRRATESMTYWDSSSFPDEVAKAIVASRRPAPHADSPTREGERLKSCPFCGGEAEVGTYSFRNQSWRVACNSADWSCGGEAGPYETMAEAIAAWNRRPAPVTEVEGEQELVEAACAIYAKETGYYVEFHRGLRSESADKMRQGMRKALAASLARVTAERDEARDSVKRTREWLSEAQHRAGNNLGRATAAEARAARLEEALKFYAEDKRYQGANQRPMPNDPHQPDGFPYLWSVERDLGDIARRALHDKEGA